MNQPAGTPLVINGWSVLAHPLFLDQLGTMIRQVESLKQKDPVHYTEKRGAKLLAAVHKLAFEVIPQDPGRSEYRQGDTLGKEYTHWRRAKFFQQYRLFFRYHSEQRMLLYVWVNDENTKRAYGSSDDAYRVFRNMLQRKCPPDDWEQLQKEAGTQAARLQHIRTRQP